ncbi:MAG: acyl carrier protein [Candidatus Omnitrophica bacterium]|nr:acyl carrier protein [Candidatus Omnitrophota bacterium]MBL7151360.1 acyl carrier protein [Candidatus Omnitrophota bacterium]MBL7210577.1 acyl carrier protein [Candidatus Omnitrophota bacterium]
METKERIKDILSKLLKVKPEELKDDVSLESSIGVDSTEMVETVIALEKAFNTKLSPKEIIKSSTINDIEAVIKSKLSADEHN